jgi:hypothetical protein
VDPRCVGDDCPRPCETGASYTSLQCRLTVIDTALTQALTLGTLRARFTRHLDRSRIKLDRSEARCRNAQRGPARRSLRQFRMRILAVGRRLRSKPVRRTLPPSMTGPLAPEVETLAADARLLGRTLACP